MSSGAKQAHSFTDVYYKKLHVHAQPAVDMLTLFLDKELGSSCSPDTVLFQKIERWCKERRVPQDVKNLMHGIRMNGNYLRHPDTSRLYDKELPYGTSELLLYQEYGTHQSPPPTQSFSSASSSSVQQALLIGSSSHYHSLESALLLPSLSVLNSRCGSVCFSLLPN